MDGVKHLVQCHCVLPQYRKRKDPVFHKFLAFSIIDDDDNVIPKFVQCDNCGIVHRVIDICKSEFVTGREELKTFTQKADIAFSLDKSICEVLESYNCDISTWEEVKFIIDYQKWGRRVVLTRETIDSQTQGKALVINGRNDMQIEPFVINDTIELGGAPQ
jgi:hypothetical protein